MTIMYTFYDLNSFFFLYCNDKNCGERIMSFNSEAEQIISGHPFKQSYKNHETIYCYY